MRKLFLKSLSILLLGLMSCQEDSFNVSQDINETVTTGSRSAGDGKYDVLGYGYDVTGEYLHPMSVKNPVLDIARYEKDRKERIVTGNSSFGSDQMYYGYSASDYIKDIMRETNVGASISYGNEKEKNDSLGFFSGNISQNNYLKTEYQYSTKYSFVSLDAVRNHKYIRINDEITNLSKYLLPSFLEDLKNLSPERVVERYGTHVLTDYVIGGRYKLIYRSVITDSKDTTHKRTTVSSGFKATLFNIGFSFNVDRTIQTDETLIKNNQNKELYVLFYGGNGTNLKYDLEKGMPTNVDIQNWENSVKLENACLNKITWNETYPIYAFIEDSRKKAQIKEAMMKYLKATKFNELQLKPLYVYFNDKEYMNGFNHYTTSLSNITEKYPDWKLLGIEGYILAEPLLGTIPLYEYYWDKGFDHYTTTLANIHNEYEDWKKLGIAGYVYKDIMLETTPLYEYEYLKGFDHYTSTDPEVCQKWLNWQSLNHISGYVYPQN